jgi:glycosyltransferase involved in cell wall biosynthesis
MSVNGHYTGSLAVLGAQHALSRAGRAPAKGDGPIRILEFRSAEGAGGGPEKTILLGAAQSEPDRFAVTVCYIRDARNTTDEIGARARQLGVDYVEIRQRRRLDPAVWRTTRHLVRERHIDIVHAHDYKTNLLALLLARTDGVIPLSTAHGWTGRSWREQFLYYPIDKRLLGRFPLVIAVSGQIRRDLLRTGARPERVRTVLNGIDHQAFRRRREREAEARTKLGIKPGELVIGGIGRLAPEKRFDVLLKAVALLRRQRPALQLLFAGEGPSRADLEGLAGQLGISSACRFLGHYGNIPELHHALDILVQSSIYEGTPNVVLEAMALETPIVATDAGGTAEIIEPGVHGLVVPPDDPGALVQAVEWTLADRQTTARRVKAARRRVEGELSFDTRMQTVEAIYEELMRTYRGGT